MMTGIGMGIGALGILLMLLFWGAVIFGGVWLVRALIAAGQQNKPEGSPTGPQEILKGRYARGEITREQFEQMKRDLQS